MNFKKLKSGFSLGYAFFFIIPYVVVPYVFAYSKFPVYVSLLAQMTIISTLAFWIAFNVPFGLSFKTIKVSLEYDNAMFVLYGLFLFIVLIIFITAPNIPIIESLRGASDAELIAYREGFEKGSDDREFGEERYRYQSQPQQSVPPGWTRGADGKMTPPPGTTFTAQSAHWPFPTKG
jgi:hypothetical protein